MTLVVPNELCSDGTPTSAGHHSSAAAVDRHFTRRGHGLEFEMEVRWISRSLPAGAKRVLDIGCGIGALLSVIGEARAVGIDHVFAGLRRTRDQFPGSRLACGDGATLPFANAIFDAITTQHVIEHMPDPDAACREWRRVLRPQGRLIIVTPNAEFRDPSIFDDPTHVTIFSRRTLRIILEKAGFTVDFICTLGLPWFRNYHEVPGGWRLRRMILGNACTFAQLPGMRGAGQSLCCIARRSAS